MFLDPIAQPSPYIAAANLGIDMRGVCNVLPIDPNSVVPQMNDVYSAHANLVSAFRDCWSDLSLQPAARRRYWSPNAKRNLPRVVRVTSLSSHVTNILAAGALALGIGVALVALSPALVSAGLIAAAGFAADAIMGVGVAFIVGAIGAFILGWAETFMEQVDFSFTPCLGMCNPPSSTS